MIAHIVVPPGYGSAEEFAQDCGFELAATASDDSIYAAYLGICVLRTMCKKAKLSMAEERARDLLVELDTAFPGLSGRAALRVIPPAVTSTDGKTP